MHCNLVPLRYESVRLACDLIDLISFLKEVTETADVEVTSFRLAFGAPNPRRKKRLPFISAFRLLQRNYGIRWGPRLQHDLFQHD